MLRNSFIDEILKFVERQFYMPKPAALAVASKKHESNGDLRLKKE